MKNMVLLWSTSVEKDSSNCLFLGGLFFPFLGGDFFVYPFLTWDNALIMMIITLILIYNSILQLDTRTKYDSIWMPPTVYRNVQWIKSDMPHIDQIIDAGKLLARFKLLLLLAPPPCAGGHSGPGGHNPPASGHSGTGGLLPPHHGTFCPQLWPGQEVSSGNEGQVWASGGVLFGFSS